MAWTKNGDIITQTGIDEGVGNLYEAASSANRNRTQHINFYSLSLEGLQVRIEGEWDIQAETDELKMLESGLSDGLIEVYGIMRLNSEFTANGTTLIDPRTPLKISVGNFNFQGVIQIESGGQIQTKSFIDVRTDSDAQGIILAVKEGGTFQSRDGGVALLGGGSGNRQLRFANGSTMDIIGLDMTGMTLTQQQINIINNSGIRITRVNGLGQLIAGTISQTEKANYEGMDFDGTNTPLQFNTASPFSVGQINSPVPIDEFIIVRNNPASPDQQFVDFSATVKLNANDIEGNAIAEARAVIIDNPTEAGIIDEGLPSEYDAGQAFNQEIANDETQTIVRSSNTNAGGFFHRGKDGSSDIFDYRIRSFLHLDQDGTIDLSGAGEKTLASTLLNNAGVTETDNTVVEAYPIATTSREAYDYDRVDRVVDPLSDRNITIDLDTETIDYGEMDVVVSGTPTPPSRPIVYNDDNTQATIYVGDTGVFTGNIVTTGSLILQEGATVDGSTKSSRGTTIKLTGFPSGRQGVVVAWLQSEGIDNAFTTTHAGVVNEQAELLLENDTAYFVRVDCIGYRRQIFRLDTTTQTSLVVDLEEYGNNSDGVFTPILPATLTTEQQAIADMFSSQPYPENNEKTHIIITLPDDYTSDGDRWDHDRETFTFLAQDFVPIAYKIKIILQEENLLENQYTIDLEESDIIFESNFVSAAFCQSADNVNGIEINFGGFSMRRIDDDLQVNSFIDRSRGNIRVRAIQPSASLPALATIQTTLAEVKTSVVDDRSELEKPTQDEFNQYMDNTTTDIQDKYKGAGGSGGFTTEQEEKIDDLKTGQTEIKNGQLN